MQTREWTGLRDRTGWPAGPWDGEPDKRQWTDEATGLPCLIVRSNSLGFLCGYVGVSADHPWYGLDYGNQRLWDVDVHGGLTFSGLCDGDETGICHVADEGEPETVKWFGFDCGHGGDVIPYRMTPAYRKRVGHLMLIEETETYKDVAYVAEQCRGLASQLARAALGVTA